MRSAGDAIAVGPASDAAGRRRRRLQPRSGARARWRATKPAVARPRHAAPAARRRRRRRTPAAADAPRPAERRIYSLAELPETIRRELPKLIYGGGSYSGDKASRLVFLNGQVFHEGDTSPPAWC